MAAVELRSQVFAEGETVTAYPVSNWSQAQLPPSGAAVGSSAGVAGTVSGGLVRITGLSSDTEYFARGGTTGAYVRFRSPKADPVADADTVGNSQSSAAPGAGTGMCTVTVTAGGTYRLEITVNLSGTAETQLANLRLRDNTTNLFTLPSLQGTAKYAVERVANAGGNFNVQVIAAATAGSIYTIGMTATRVE